MIERFVRIWTDSAHPDDEFSVTAWLSADPSHAIQMENLRHLWDMSRGLTHEGNIERFRRRVHAETILRPVFSVNLGNLGALPPRPIRVRQPATRWPASSRRLLLAALGCIGVVATGSWFMRDRLIAPVTQTHSTLAGQRKAVTLPNGSHALLGPSTTLSVSTGSVTNAEVVGEVLFTVAHRENAPFVVRTGNAMARVLGTTFLVRRYGTDSVARVLVAEGRVALESKRTDQALRSSLILTPGELGTVSDSGQVRLIQHVAIDDYTTLTKGRLVFSKTLVKDVAVELGRAYGVEIRLADSTLGGRTLTWTVPVNEQSLTDVLEALATAINARVTRSEHVVTLFAAPAATPRLERPRTLKAAEVQYGR